MAGIQSPTLGKLGIISGNSVEIQETVPTDPTKVNGSLVITYDASNQPITVVKTINGTTYTKNLTWTGGVCTAVSSWT